MIRPEPFCRECDERQKLHKMESKPLPCNWCKTITNGRNVITYTEFCNDTTLPACEAMRFVCDECYQKFNKLTKPVHILMGHEPFRNH